MESFNTVLYPGFSLREDEFSCPEGRQNFFKGGTTVSVVESIILMLSKDLRFVSYIKGVRVWVCAMLQIPTPTHP